MVSHLIISLVLIAFCIALRNKISLKFLNIPLSRYTPLFLFAVFFIIYLSIKFNRHFSLHTFGYDLSAFDYAYYNAIHGDFLYSPFFGKSYLQEHFFPSMILVLPFYALNQHVETLLVLQSLFVAATIFPFYAIVRHFAGNDIAALIFTTALMMNPYMVAGVEFDFHIEMLQPLLFSMVILCALKKRIVLYSIFLLLFILTKENEWITAIALSVSIFILLKDRRLSAITILLGIISGVFIMIYIKHGHQAAFPKYLKRYAEYGQTTSDVILFILSHPKVLVSENNFHQAAKLLLTVSLLPLFSPMTFAAIPDFLVHALSAARQQKLFQLYYAAGIITMLFISGAFAYRSICNKYGKSLLPFLVPQPDFGVDGFAHSTRARAARRGRAS